MGIGTDCVDIRRIEGLLSRFHRPFVRRFFTPYEQEQACHKSHPATFYATRFAAKEACAKAVGTGFTPDLSWQDIEIQNTKKGRPFLLLAPHVQESLGNGLPVRTKIQLDLSLTDEYPYAVAFVVISCTAGP